MPNDQFNDWDNKKSFSEPGESLTQKPREMQPFLLNIRLRFTATTSNIDKIKEKV
jgi:hypothetical protein